MKNITLINKEAAGIILISSWIFVLLASLIWQWGFLTTLAFLVAVLILIIFLFNPLIGFSIFLIFRPATDSLSSHYSLHLNENISLNLASLLGILIIVLTVFFVLRNKINLFKIPLFYPITLFTLAVFITISYSLNHFTSFYESIRVLSIFFIFILAYILGQNNKKRKFIIESIIIASFLPILWALFQLITKTGLGGTSGIESRLYGTFVHPNSFASFLIIIMALSFYLVLQEKTKTIFFYAYSFLFALSGFLLLETFSRGAWLAILIFLFFYGVIRSPKIIIGGITILIILFFTMPSFHDRIEDIYNPPADSSIVWRFQKWQRVLAVIKKHPWLGEGAGTEVMVHEKEYGFYAGNPYTHNDFLKMWLETGLMGLIFYLILIIDVIFNLVKSYYKKIRDKNNQIFILIVLLIFVAELGFSMSSNIWRGTATMWTLWALIGVAMRIIKENQKRVSFNSH